MRRGATDPVCGMKVDRARAVTKEVDGQTFYFCSDHCWHAFEAEPDRYLHGGGSGHEPEHVHAH
jgi:YHS domain-containing protein